jgi:hypothetical protein
MEPSGARVVKPANHGDIEMKTRIRKDRLTLLANVLESLDGFISPHFTMLGWSTVGDNNATTPKEVVDCGSAACAAGYAATIPQFRREGFKLERGLPTFGRYTGFAACERFFGLNSRQANRVFGGDEARTLEREVQVIRNFVARV